MKILSDSGRNTHVVIIKNISELHFGVAMNYYEGPPQIKSLLQQKQKLRSKLITLF